MRLLFNRYLRITRVEDMSTMTGYSDLLERHGHKVKILINNASNRKNKKINSSGFIYSLQLETGSILKGEKSNFYEGYVSDIL